MKLSFLFLSAWLWAGAAGAALYPPDKQTNSALWGMAIAQQINGITNVAATATTAEIQSALDRGGNVGLYPGATYSVSNLFITKATHIFGHDATFTPAAGITNFLIDTGTGGTATGPVVLEDLTVDGLCVPPGAFNSSTFFSLLNGSLDPYYNANWTNSSGLRIDSAVGGMVRNCVFRRWAGQGVMIINSKTTTAFSFARVDFQGNRCYSNFIGGFVVSASYDTAGYYNNAAGGWLNQTAEYQHIRGNQFFRNQMGLVAPAGNVNILGNTMTDNYIGLFEGTGNNNGHGITSGNTVNHNTYGMWFESTQGGVVTGNSILANSTAQLIAGITTDLIFSENFIGSGSTLGLMVTNACTGWIKNNFYQGKWGTDVPTNFTGSTLTVNGNFSEDGSNDGSAASTVQNGGVSPSWSGSSGNTTLAAATTYFFPPNFYSSTLPTADASAGTRQPVTRLTTVRGLYITLSAAGGSGKHYVATVMTNGVASNIVADANNATTANDTTHSVQIIAGVEVGIRVAVDSGATVAKISWSLEGN